MAITISSTSTLPSYVLPVGGDYSLVIESGGAIIRTTNGDALVASGAPATVDNSGTVSAGFGNGVVLNAGGTVTNNADALIHGDKSGLIVSGDLGTLINLGTVEAFSTIASYYSGVALLAGGSVQNSGTGARISGHNAAVVVSGGAGTVANEGTITGHVSGVSLENGGLVSNDGAAATILSAYGAAIQATNASASVVNYGTLTGFIGVQLDAGGTVTNAAGTASIYGGAYGVRMFNVPGTVTNYGRMFGTSNGGAYLGGGGTVINTGTVAWIDSTGGTGVRAHYTATVVNTDGIIHGKYYGVEIDRGVVRNNGTAGEIYSDGAAIKANYFARVINSAEILSNQDAGVDFSRGGKITNLGTGSNITGATYGVRLGRRGFVRNQGHITGTTPTIGAGIEMKNGTVTNLGTYSGIYGGALGIHATGTATVVNHGSISGFVGGVSLHSGVVRNAGWIYGPSAAVYGYTNTTVFNTGTLQGAVGVSTAAYQSNTLNNDGLISATSQGVVAGYAGTITVNNGLNNRHALINGIGFQTGSGPSYDTLSTAYVVNSGTITQGASSGFPAAILAANTHVTNNARGVIYGTVAVAGFATTDVYNAGHMIGIVPVLSVGAATVTNVAGGSIEAYGGPAIASARGNVTVTNGGTINAKSSGGGGLPFPPTAIVAGVGFFGGGSASGNAYVTNLSRGMIYGYLDGIRASYGSVGVTNYGAIVGTKGYGVFSYAGGTVTNASKHASIYGHDWGVYVPSAGGAMTVTNHGTIASYNCDSAVHFSDADGNVFETFRGAIAKGVVLGGSGFDTLRLGASALPGAIGGINGSSVYQNFEGLAVDAGAVWKLTGQNTLGSGGTVEVDAGATLKVQGLLTTPDDLSVSGSGMLRVAGGAIEVGLDGLAKPGQLVVDVGHALTNDGTISVGKVRNFGVVGGDGVLLIDAGGDVLNKGTIGASGGTPVEFSAGGGTFRNVGGSSFLGGVDNAVVGDGAPLTVSNDGTITASVTNGVWLQDGGTVTNTGTASSIYGGTNGILDTGGDGTVFNRGSIGGGTCGVRLDAANGVVRNLGTASAITGGAVGVYAPGLDATVVNGGYIAGSTSSGVAINSGFIRNSGTIAGPSVPGARGISADSAKVINTGLIAGYNAIYGRSTNTVVNDGGITAVNAGIYGGGLGALTVRNGLNNSSAAIRGNQVGVFSQGFVDVVNAGSIYGAGYSPVFANGVQSNHDDARVTNRAGGYIGGRFDGVRASGGAEVTNAGLIHGGQTGVLSGSGTATVDNLGTITGGALYGIRIDADGTIRNLGTASLISGHYAGISAYSATVVNQGTIKSGLNGDGLFFEGGGNVANLGRAAAIIGSLYGISSGGAALTVSNSGTITGTYLYGIRSTDIASVTNSSVHAVIQGGQIGVALRGSADSTVSNSGTIAGGSVEGVLAFYGTVSNVGSLSRITGGNIGVAMGIGTVSNDGTIHSSGYAGVTGGQYVTNNLASSVISGGSWGVNVGGALALTVVNHGTISGTTGAIVFPDQIGNELVLFPGAVENGQVLGGDFSDVLALEAGGTGAISGIGSQFTQFETIVVAAGATWKATGVNAADVLTGVSIDTGGTLTVTGRLSTPGDLTLDGTGLLATSGGGRIEIGTAGQVNPGQMMIDAGNTLTAAGTISAGKIRVAGDLIASGTLMLDGAVVGGGNVSITPGSVLTATGLLGAHDVTFLPGGGESLFLDVGASARMHGFVATDTIDLVAIGDVVSKLYTPATHLLDIVGTGGSTSLHFAGVFVDADFAANNDGSGGIVITHT